MITHTFLFTPGYWLGEGRITFSTSSEILHFYTRWNIAPSSQSIIACHQDVEMRESGDNLHNFFAITDVREKNFRIDLSNNIIGTVTGTGILDAKTIAWEFRNSIAVFEGFEVYELQSDGDYMLHAEYSSPDQLRTIIDGRIWQKNSPA